MTPRTSGFAVAGLFGVLSSGAPFIAAGSSPIGIDRDDHPSLESEAPFATDFILFGSPPAGAAADLGAAAGGISLYQAPKGSVLDLTDGQWTRVGAGEISGPLGRRIEMPSAAQAVSVWDGRRGRGTRPGGWDPVLDGAAGEERPALLVGTAGRARDLDPRVQLSDARCEVDQRETDRVDAGGAREGMGRRQARQGVQEVAGGGTGPPAELVRLDAGIAFGAEEELVRMIKSWAWPPWK